MGDFGNQWNPLLALRDCPIETIIKLNKHWVVIKVEPEDTNE